MDADEGSAPDEEQSMVVDRVALSISDISCMRLDGCRVPSRSSRASHRWSHPQRPHRQPVGDVSSSLSHAASQGSRTSPPSFVFATRVCRSFDSVSQSGGVFDSLVRNHDGESVRSNSEVVKHNTCLEHSQKTCLSSVSLPPLSEACRGHEVSYGLSRRRMSFTSSFSPLPCSPVPKELSPGLLTSIPWNLPTLGWKGMTPTASNVHEGQATNYGEEQCGERVANDTRAYRILNMSNSGGAVATDASVSRERWFHVQHQSFRKRYIGHLNCVYAIYRSLLPRNSPPAASQNISLGGTPTLDRRVRSVALSSASTVTGVAAGYYTLSDSASTRCSGGQNVPVVPRAVRGFSPRRRGRQRALSSREMDPFILGLIKRRVLFRTTIFCEYTYNCIKHSEELRLSSSEIVEPYTEQEYAVSSHSQNGSAFTTSVGRAESDRVATSASDGSSSIFFDDTHRTAPPPGNDGKRRTSVVSPPHEETPMAVHHRTLTRLQTLTTKVHSVDRVMRTVDNEEDDLVVYVGMILMGWLEVVDLLGSGTFGQVFLCKDLRIANKTFVHPSQIEGDDFQYWQCSHTYIPFGDPSMVPTHTPLVAVKVVKSRELFEQQSAREAEILVHVSSQTASQEEQPAEEQQAFPALSFSDPPVPDYRCEYVGKILAHGICYGHHCIVMERYGVNLFEYAMARGFKGLPMYQIQDIGRKILLGLTLLHEECHVVHCDIKPENVLITLDSWLSANPVHMALTVGAHTPGSGASGAISLDASAGQLHQSLRWPASNGLPPLSDSKLPNGAVHSPTPRRMQIAASTERMSMSSILREAAPAGSAAASSPGLNNGAEDDPNLPRIPASPSLLPLNIKLIDFSSSSYIGKGIHTYVQSRYYRAPEVIVGAGYGPAIDVWSTGCLLAELLLGLPLLPGDSDHHQLSLIEEMLGPLPLSLLAKGAATLEYYDVDDVELRSESAGASASEETPAGHKKSPSFRLLSEEEYLRHHRDAKPTKGKRYFQFHTLAELIRKCTASNEERCIATGYSPSAAMDANVMEMVSTQQPRKEIADEISRHRFRFYDLLKKMLHGDPERRLTAREALAHSFFQETPKYLQVYSQR